MVEEEKYESYDGEEDYDSEKLGDHWKWLIIFNIVVQLITLMVVFFYNATSSQVNELEATVSNLTQTVQENTRLITELSSNAGTIPASGGNKDNTTDPSVTGTPTSPKTEIII